MTNMEVVKFTRGLFLDSLEKVKYWWLTKGYVPWN